MNRKGYDIVLYVHYYTAIYLEGQSQTMKDFRVSGLEAEI